VTLFTFTDHGGAGVPASDFTATITWGDGTSDTVTTASSSPAEIVFAGSGTDANGPYSIFDVVTTANSHLYDEVATGGQFTVQATDIGSGNTTGPVSTPVVVTDKAPVFVSQAQDTITTPENVPATNSGVFSDYDESMTITASQGTLSDNGNGTWSWTQTGDGSESGTVTITATNTDGSSTSATFSVTFTDAALTAGTLTPPVAMEGTALSNVVLWHFTDADPNATVSDYQATVTWGDGSVQDSVSNPSAVQVVASPAGGFDVVGSHSYSEEASGLTFSVGVQDSGGAAPLRASASIQVADAALTAGTLTPPVATAGDPLSNLVLWHFQDATPRAARRTTRRRSAGAMAAATPPPTAAAPSGWWPTKAAASTSWAPIPTRPAWPTPPSGFRSPTTRRRPPRVAPSSSSTPSRPTSP
jgi:hypothetical protein